RLEASGAGSERPRGLNRAAGPCLVARVGAGVYDVTDQVGAFIRGGVSDAIVVASLSRGGPGGDDARRAGPKPRPRPGQDEGSELRDRRRRDVEGRVLPGRRQGGEGR